MMSFSHKIMKYLPQAELSKNLSYHKLGHFWTIALLNSFPKKSCHSCSLFKMIYLNCNHEIITQINNKHFDTNNVPCDNNYGDNDTIKVIKTKSVAIRRKWYKLITTLP